MRAWMTSKAAKDEFDIVPEEWLKTGGLEISDDEEAVTDLKTLLISKEFTQRKKSLLKKQIKDLKEYMDVHLPKIVENKDELNTGWNYKNIKYLQKEPNGHQKNYKIKNKNIQINKVGGPDGQGQKTSRLQAQSLPDPGPDDHNTTVAGTVVPPTSNGGDDATRKGGGVKLQFLQKNITEFFQNQGTINFDVEMKRLERERRLEIQRRKELAWRDRRAETKKQMEMKEKRLEKAALGTITARTSALRLRETGETEGVKRPRDDDGDWLRALNTPPKKQRMPRLAPAATAVPAATAPSAASVADRMYRCTETAPPPSVSTSKFWPPSAYMCTPGSEKKTGLVIAPPARPALFVDNSVKNIDITTTKLSSNVEEKRKLFEKPSKLKLQGLPKVKTKKWVRKKDGMYGWVTSLARPAVKLMASPESKKSTISIKNFTFKTRSDSSAGGGGGLPI